MDNTNIINLRIRAELSQQKLAELAGITASAISMIEAGQREPLLSTVIAIADVFNVSLDEIANRSSINEFCARIELTKLKQIMREINQLTKGE